MHSMAKLADDVGQRKSANENFRDVAEEQRRLLEMDDIIDDEDDGPPGKRDATEVHLKANSIVPFQQARNEPEVIMID